MELEYRKLLAHGYKLYKTFNISFEDMDEFLKWKGRLCMNRGWTLKSLIDGRVKLFIVKDNIHRDVEPVDIIELPNLATEGRTYSLTLQKSMKWSDVSLGIATIRISKSSLNEKGSIGQPQYIFTRHSFMPGIKALDMNRIYEVTFGLFNGAVLPQIRTSGKFDFKCISDVKSIKEYGVIVDCTSCGQDIGSFGGKHVLPLQDFSYIEDLYELKGMPLEECLEIIETELSLLENTSQ